MLRSLRGFVVISLFFSDLSDTHQQIFKIFKTVLSQTVCLVPLEFEIAGLDCIFKWNKLDKKVQYSHFYFSQLLLLSWFLVHCYLDRRANKYVFSDAELNIKTKFHEVIF